MLPNCFVRICFAVFTLFLLHSNALAHKVTVFAWVEGDRVFGESKFSGGRKARGADIIVWDLEGNELLRTKTDDNGEFSFPIPRKSGMRIELLAGMGHKGEWTIPAKELAEEVASSGIGGNKTAKNPQTDASLSPSGEVKSETVAFPLPNTAELEFLIEKSVEKSLDKKMKPLMKMMADLEQKGPALSEIFGGIGYIFGLMGVVLYFKSRQKKD
ncbi:MAG: hypothetical protein V2I97_15195 [Desulfococcaceae bacterium]|nr:hypothetical protein [Desulfococcaceae bacterium]